MMIFASVAPAEEHTGRIKRKPPGATEAERIASDMAMNDSLLQKGDIVATDRGFFIFSRDGSGWDRQRLHLGSQPLVVKQKIDS
jgi:hypothetical protein